MALFDPKPEYEKLQSLRFNVRAWASQSFIECLKKDWSPKTRISEFEIYHGSKKGDIESTTLYWDEHSLKWTNKEAAFQGYVFNQIKEFLN